MRRRRILIILVLAIASGALAGFSALRFLQERPTRLVSQDANANSRPVVVAARELPMGHLLSENDVQVVSWPQETVPAGYATSVTDVVGRGLLTSVSPNEPLLEPKLASRGVGGGLGILIPEGMRAIALQVDEVSGVAGFVTPGRRVDVLLTVTPRGSSEPLTQIVLQNLQALSAAQTWQENEEGEAMPVPVITVLVTPDDAEKLTHAATQGRIHLALRNPLDLEDVDTNGARLAQVLGESSAPRPAARVVRRTVPAQPDVIEFYRAGQRTLISY